jgi:hypothetical protein
MFLYYGGMINNDLTERCERELELWVMNDEYLNQQWRKTIRTGNMIYIKEALESFTYTKAQWDHLVDCFEEELKEEEERLDSYCSVLQ